VAELSELQAEADMWRTVYGEAITTIPTAARLGFNLEPAVIDVATGKVRTLIELYRAELRQSVRQAAQRLVGALLSAPVVEQPTVEEGPDLPEPTTEQANHTGAEQRARQERLASLVTRAADLLSRLPATSSAQVRGLCERAVAEVAGATSEGRARLVLADLSARIRAETARATAIHHAQVELADLLARLDTAPAGVGDELRERLRGLAAARPERVPDGLAVEVDTLLVEVDRQRQRRATADALRLTLDELGYDVSEGFETTLATQGVSYARLPRADGYGLKVLLDRDQAVLRTRVVRRSGAGHDLRADIAAEELFCQDYPGLLDRLTRHGVATQELGRYPPGTVEVQTVEDRLIPQARHRRGEQGEREA
jgi:hypothetical protein